MIKLTSCDHCASFLPAGASECPNCDTGVGPTVRRVARPLIALTGGVLAMTLSACYGGAVEDYDSGPDVDATMDSSTDTGAGDATPGDSGGDATPGDGGGDATPGDGGGDAAADGGDSSV